MKHLIPLHGHQLVPKRACFEPSPCNCPTLCVPTFNSTAPLTPHILGLYTDTGIWRRTICKAQPGPLSSGPHTPTPTHTFHPPSTTRASIYTCRAVLHVGAATHYVLPNTCACSFCPRRLSPNQGRPCTIPARCRLRLSSRQPRVRIREPFQPVNTNCPRHRLSQPTHIRFTVSQEPFQPVNTNCPASPRHRLSPTTNAHSLHPLTLLSPPHAHTHNAHRNPSPREDPLVQDLLDKAGAELGTSRSWRRSVSSADITGGQHTPQGGRTALSSSSSPAHGGSPSSSSSSSASSFSSRHAARPVRIGGRVALR